MSSPHEKFFSAQELFDDLQQTYENAFRDDHGLIQTIHKLIAKLPPRAKVLDVGCGTGKPVGSLLAEAGFEVHGIDVSSAMVDLAKKNVKGTFTNVSMSDYKPPYSFDAIVCIFSLFQVPFQEVRRYLANFASWLRPHGIFLVGTIGGEVIEPKSSFDPELGFADDLPTTWMGYRCIQSLITSDGWHKLFEDTGLDIISSEVLPFKPKHENALEEPHLFIIAQKGAQGPQLEAGPLPKS